MKTAQQKKDELAIRNLIEAWSRAIEAKDADAIVAAYTPKTVLYDAIPPSQTIGADAIKAVWAQCLPYFPDKLRSEHKDLVIEVDGDVAFVHGMHHFVPEPADHPMGSTWMRVTACYRRIDGQWRVAHEHVSVPFDPMTGKATTIGDAGDVGAMPTCGEPVAEQTAETRIHSVTPHLVCAGADRALEFYKQAFGATEKLRLAGPDGKLMHACIDVNGSSVMLADECPEMGGYAPTSLKGTPVTIHLEVKDVDAAAARAVSAGAKVIMPVADQFWGDRYGVIEDPFGHRWSIATPQQSLTAEQLQNAATKAIAEMAAA